MVIGDRVGLDTEQKTISRRYVRAVGLINGALYRRRFQRRLRRGRHRDQRPGPDRTHGGTWLRMGLLAIVLAGFSLDVIGAVLVEFTTMRVQGVLAIIIGMVLLMGGALAVAFVFRDSSPPPET